MLTNARRRAKEKGFQFDLKLDDIVIPETCPVLGLRLSVGSSQGPCSPSLDRIDGSRGYVKGNVRVISWRANDVKGDATADELEAVAGYVRATLADVRCR